MKRLRFTPLLLKPSIVSFLGVFVVITLILMVAIWSNIIKSGAIYEYLLGNNSSAQLIQSSKDTIAAFNNTIFGNPLLNKILFIVFWLFVGLLVYGLLSGIGLGISSADHHLHELHYINARRQELRENLRARLLFRSIVLIGWVLYSIVFFKLILPFSMLCIQIAVNPLFSIHGLVYGAMAIITLFLSLHLHIVWARFFLLRPRIFSGWEEIVSDLD